MEVSTPLNQAHFYVRKAEKLTKTGKFEEAIALQDRIVDQLQLALLEAEDTKVRESLELQIEFHRKEKGLISERAAQWEHFCRQLTSLQLKMSSASVSDGLQDSIFRTFQETESLLEHLRDGTQSEPSDPTTGAKMPKDDKIIIEELQTANNHLRGMVEAMFSDLESYKKENNELRARVKDLEAEKAARAGSGLPSALATVLSNSGQIPDLAPLELPQFEYPSK